MTATIFAVFLCGLSMGGGTYSGCQHEPSLEANDLMRGPLTQARCEAIAAKMNVHGASGGMHYECMTLNMPVWQQTSIR